MKILLDIEEDGEVLVIEDLDGTRTRWRVNPVDVPTAVLWTPSAEIQIDQIADMGSTHRITNISTGQRARATPASEGKPA